MKKSAKFLSICLLLCFLVIIAVSCVSCSGKAQNLVYIIGDGMGPNHIKNAKLFAEKPTFAFEGYYVSDVTTHSASDAVTDSAAAATALATGVKTNNDYVGVNPKGKDLQNIMELSKRRGKKTGIVTTDTLDGATPSGFSAHAESRDDTNDIMEDQSNSKIDLFIGKHSSAYKYRNMDFINNDYTYVQTLEDLQSCTNDQKILANVENLGSTFDPNTPNAVSLKSLVAYALDYLSADNDKGFTLMVEGAYIDKYSHSNDIKDMIYAMLDLNEAVEYVLEWAKNRDDTVVIFTADHETCGLSLAQSKDALADSLFTASYHTDTKVPLYLFNISTTQTSFDNVDVYKLAKQVVLNRAEFVE